MTTPTLSPADFSFTTTVPKTKDIWKFSETIAEALLKAAGVKAQSVSLGSSMGERKLPANGRVGVNVLSVKSKGPVHEFSVVQAVFDAKGAPLAWSFALDPDGDPKRPDKLRVFGISAADVTLLKALSKKTPKKAPAASGTPFALERAASEIVVAANTVAVRSEAQVRLFDLQGTPTVSVKVGGFPRTMALSADGSRLVSGLKKLTVFGADGAKQLAIEGHPKGEVVSLAFSPSGARLVTASGVTFQGGEKALALWDASSGKQLAWVKLNDVPRYVTFSPDGQFVLAATARNDAVLRFTAGLKEAGELRFGSEVDLSRACAGGGVLLVQVGTRLLAVDMKTLKERTLKVPVTSHGFQLMTASPDGSRVLVATQNYQARKTVRELHTLSTKSGKVLSTQPWSEDAWPEVACFLSNEHALVGRGGSLVRFEV